VSTGLKYDKNCLKIFVCFQKLDSLEDVDKDFTYIDKSHGSEALLTELTD
jgi:hypothetical protein